MTVFFVSRLRATSPAAAAPNRISIGGAGTGDGLPLLLPELDGGFPLDDQPWLDPQPFELDPYDELLVEEEVDDDTLPLELDEVEDDTLPLELEDTLPLDDDVLLTPPLDVDVDDPPLDVEVDPPLELEVDEITIPLDPPPEPPLPPKNPPAKNPPPPPKPPPTIPGLKPPPPPE